MAEDIGWFIDWACILIWVAFTAAVGVPLYLAGVIAPRNTAELNLVGAVVMVVPVVVAAAYFESRPIAATPGKRALGLAVIGHSKRPRFAVVLVRNLLKLAVPWLIGHAVVFAIVTSSSTPDAVVPTGVWILTVAAYLIPLVWIVSLFVRGGRTPYDRLTGTSVMLRRTIPQPAR